MGAIQGPGGGEWLLCNGRFRCWICGSFVEHAWRYFIGVVSHMDVCETCADRESEAA